jgi:[FeFe] hydrogenase H-cluster maturation GTPase HydF
MNTLNDTPTSERVHIAIFGKRNAGKSSLINAITGQSLSIVSEIAGTTTDPVYKSMEILPMGPVVLIDTPGIDDGGELGALRIEKTQEVLRKTNVAILVVDSSKGFGGEDKYLLEQVKSKNIPYIIVMNKSDLTAETQPTDDTIYVSAKENKNIEMLKEKIASLSKFTVKEQVLIEDLLNPSDLVVLVMPQDKAAPKGRLILPEQQTVRAVLDADAINIVIRENEIDTIFDKINGKIKMVVTDSQVFDKISKSTPDDILLTSFSILFARYRGILETAVKGVKAVDNLKDGDFVLISEGCTHHRQCTDIGKVKLPAWIDAYTGKKINYEWSAGREFPIDTTKYSIIVHCGGCMLNDSEVQYRYNSATENCVPITNYGILIAYIHGILERSVRPFEDIHKFLE